MDSEVRGRRSSRVIAWIFLILGTWKLIELIVMAVKAIF